MSYSRLKFALAVFCVGCSSQVRIQPRPEIPVALWNAPQDRLWLEADSLFALRLDAKEAVKAEKAFSKAAQAQPGIPALLTEWSRACFVVGLYGGLDPEESQAYFRKGVAIGEGAMRLHPEYDHVLSETEDRNEAVFLLNGPFVEAVYWTAANEGRKLNASDRYVRKSGTGKFSALVDFLLANGETLHSGGAHRMAGALAYRRQDGDNKLGDYHFQRALAIDPGYAGNYLVQAEFKAASLGDKRSFVEILNRLVDQPPDSLASLSPDDGLERRRARYLLAHADDLFPEKATRADPK